MSGRADRVKRDSPGARNGKYPAPFRSATECACETPLLRLGQKLPGHLAPSGPHHGLDYFSGGNRDLRKLLVRQTAEIETLLAELEAFSYTLSHDMRAPLRSMHSYAELLLTRHGSELSDEVRDFLSRIKAGSERLDALVQDVLKYSRISRTQIELRRIELEPLVRELVQEYPLFQQPNAEVEITAPLLPVIGHPGFLTQCLSNILTNAVKFVSPGTQPHIRISTKAIGAMVQIRFEDNGIGIAPKDYRRIFGIFQRVHAPQHFEGTGIGLAIVRRAAERMGGEVGVKSSPGKGSRFWLQLHRA